MAMETLLLQKYYTFNQYNSVTLRRQHIQRRISHRIDTLSYFLPYGSEVSRCIIKILSNVIKMRGNSFANSTRQINIETAKRRTKYRTIIKTVL